MSKEQYQTEEKEKIMLTTMTTENTTCGWYLSALQEQGAHFLPSQNLFTKSVWILKDPKGQKIHQSSLEKRAITMCPPYLLKSAEI
ncbi:hypothetical protein I79_001418 [Cricetulus griseus]|uniref:Uncharacterized protein n=1 Tax=Cricetulus griseus TaxID=10029 RepID=G3GUQ1_CRIGR|nr:hypothetical protein I79_001418 [Cricetulus griseus]